MDEEGVHNSFHELIEEQTQNGELSEALELQQLQRDLDEERRGTVTLCVHARTPPSVVVNLHTVAISPNCISSNVCLFPCPPDSVAFLSSPGRERWRERQGQREDISEDDEDQVDPLIAERWSSATLRILSSMPSRTIGGSCRRLLK